MQYRDYFVLMIEDKGVWVSGNWDECINYLHFTTFGGGTDVDNLR